MIAWPGAATEADPMSAIDWLSDTVATPLVAPTPPPERSVTPTAEPEIVSVRPIGAPSLDAVGLRPAADMGLPRDIWGASTGRSIARLLDRDRAESLPAIRELVYTITLAEFDPPGYVETDGDLLAARVDALLKFGALDAAAALLDRAGPKTPALFGRAFDVALLLGTEDAACAQLRATPDIAPSFQARVFCLARGGDWSAAALTLETGEALGRIEPDVALLMAHFLEPEFTDLDGAPPIPSPPSPLVFRVAEAIGEPIPTQGLPRAFSYADLRHTAGWKAQIEAAERLARSGALPAGRLIALYTERAPSASGGIWDRVAAIQAFDNALRAGDPAQATAALAPAWSAMQAAGLEMAFAEVFATDLLRLPLTGAARDLAIRIGFLTQSFSGDALARVEADAPFLTALARGRPQDARATSKAEEAVQAAFTADTVPTRFVPLLTEDRLGEAILSATYLFDRGVAGDLPKLTDALRLFRIAGLEDTARRAALQFLLIRAQA